MHLPQWIGILVGVEPLPIGSLLFGTDHGDLNELSSTYKWSPNLIITSYLSCSILSTLYVTLCWWMCPAVHQSIDENLAGGTSRNRLNPSSLYDWVFRLWTQLLSSLYSLSSRSALSGENFFGMIYLIFMSDGKLDSNEADFLDHMSQKFHWMFPRSIKIKKDAVDEGNSCIG